MLLGEVNQLLMAEDVAQLAWLAQSTTGYWAIWADYRNINPRIIFFINNIKKSLKSNKSGSAWVLKKQLEAIAEGKQSRGMELLPDQETFTSSADVPGKGV